MAVAGTSPVSRMVAETAAVMMARPITVNVCGGIAWA